MLTRSGKIVFGIFITGLVVLLLFLFLKSSPDNSKQLFENTIHNGTYIPTAQELNIFDTPLSLLDSAIEFVEGKVYISPNSRYALFQAGTKKVEGQMEPGSVVIIVDIQKGMLKKIYDGILVGEPSWSENIVTFSSDGVYMYTLKEGMLNVVSQSGVHPHISPDEHFIAYEDNGINIFSIQSRATTVLTQDPLDKVGAWMNDTTKLFILKNDGTELGDGAGKRYYAGVIDSATKEISELTSVPRGRLYQAKRFGDSILVTGGFDDGRSDFIVSAENNTMIPIHTNVSVADLSLDINENKVIVYTGERIKLYNDSGVEVASVLPSEKLPSDPLWMKNKNDHIWLGYTTDSDSSLVRIVKLDIASGQKIDEYIESGGSEYTFSNSLLYVTSSKDRMKLLFNTLK